MGQKIQLKHPLGKKAVSMDKLKYDILNKAFLNQLKKRGKAIAEDFKSNNIKFEGSIQWHVEWVKLDLEAKKEILRVPKTSPQKYEIKT
ncbi:MAG: hypothetical protein PHY57_08540 [Ignavibacterium sp.]|jgi:hypothetical protein|nr:MAG: hypothetical protein F9K42_02410 [Ignavibacterium sp.]MDD5608545.1 hypothetical protein [Ignavibacterium sp.]MDX9713320.1 hypothetical protein [Ignavibacteriaceae bacterium]GIK21438.1 MAG: hypothetical protein BroJett005_08520 [Ignavibacteriota bacterium]